MRNQDGICYKIRYNFLCTFQYLFLNRFICICTTRRGNVFSLLLFTEAMQQIHIGETQPKSFHAEYSLFRKEI